MGLFDNDEALSRLNDLIKVGEVSAIYPEKCTARVVFDDEDGHVSFELPILQRNTIKTKDQHTVNIGEDVLCIFLPSGPEEGFIVGSFYAGEVTPPESVQTKRTTIFEDGTVFRYDMAAHVAEIIIEGTRIVADRANITVTAPEAVTVNCTTAQVNASESVTINTPTTNVKGILNVDGKINGKGGMAISGGGGGASAVITGALEATGDIKAGSISLQNHTHTENDAGSETSSANP